MSGCLFSAVSQLGMVGKGAYCVRSLLQRQGLKTSSQAGR